MRRWIKAQLLIHERGDPNSAFSRHTHTDLISHGAAPFWATTLIYLATRELGVEIRHRIVGDICCFMYSAHWNSSAVVNLCCARESSILLLTHSRALHPKEAGIPFSQSVSGQHQEIEERRVDDVWNGWKTDVRSFVRVNERRRFQTTKTRESFCIFNFAPLLGLCLFVCVWEISSLQAKILFMYVIEEILTNWKIKNHN